MSAARLPKIVRHLSAQPCHVLLQRFAAVLARALSRRAVSLPVLQGVRRRISGRGAISSVFVSSPNEWSGAV